MKYAIKYQCPIYSTKDYPAFDAYMIRFRQHTRQSLTTVEGVKSIIDAKLYANPIEAAAIARIIRNRHPGAVVQNVTEKDLFKARLAGR